MGKGHNRRPTVVSEDELDERWRRTFEELDVEADRGRDVRLPLVAREDTGARHI